MKLKDMIIIISNKKGNCYQVQISETERFLIIEYLKQLHKGAIKIINDKLPMKIKKGGDNEKSGTEVSRLQRR